MKIAIANLKLKMSDIDAILEKKEDVTMNKFRMLKKWQEKEKSNATAQNLCNCLKNVDSVEVQDVLKGKREIILISHLLGVIYLVPLSPGVGIACCGHQVCHSIMNTNQSPQRCRLRVNFSSTEYPF